MAIEQHILDLPTPRLLAYYKKHYHKANPHDDYYGYGNTEAAIAWDKDRDTIKLELDNREHVSK